MTESERTKAILRKMREDSKTYNPASYETLRPIWDSISDWLGTEAPVPEGNEGYL